MYKTVFQNSKVALGFAALTVISAVSMVGTPEESGVVGRVTGFVEARRDFIASDAGAYAESHSVGDPPPGEGGEGDAEPSVFSDYSAASGATGTTSAASTPADGNPMTAQLAPSATVAERGPTEPTAVPFISEREMTIEPE
ncbi:MAG: hypothetical protein EAY70_11800 [Sphingomonadales bacterium]|nr:MAG: hypothetical protein EAY70_11800 [Sphingomonadales bacterium]